MSTIQNEGLDVSDIVKQEPPSKVAREVRTILAADRATLGMGDLVEYSSGVIVQKLVTAGSVKGVCISKAPQGLEFAKQYLDIATKPSDNDTVTIGTQVYNFETTIGAEDDVFIGADAAAAVQNLVSAINATVGTGTEWHASTSKNAKVHAVLISATRIQLIAILAGSAQNAVATTTSLTDGDDGFVAVTLTGGQGDEPTEAVILERGPSIVDKDRLDYGPADVATTDAALIVLGIIPRIEPATLETKRS